MRFYIIGLALFLLLVSPVFAAGETNVTAVSIAPAFANTNDSVTVLNLTFNVTQGPGTGRVNITAINVTINATAGNISFAELRNATNAPLGVNSTAAAANSFLINISGGFEVTTAANKSMVVILNISRFATRQLNISVNISTAGIFTNETANNITFKSSSGAISNSGVSHGVQIQDLHTNATISPRFVDTAVVNQSFIYTVVPTGTDKISTLLIQIPSGFTNINLTAATIDASNVTAHTNTTIGNLINITPNTPTGNRIEIYFTANTSATSVASSLFASFLYGGNLSNVTTGPTFVNQTNVTTQPLLNSTEVKILKSTAIVNGTDFWEFNFTLNYTATVASGGLVQFKLTNWSNAANQNISITNAAGATAVCGVTHCATLRNEANFSTSNKFNVTNDYESATKGISVSSITQGSLISFTLRMVIPSGTPISSTWQATYVFLFRARP